jgi:anti-sigma B factor antagonist
MSDDLFDLRSSTVGDALLIEVAGEVDMTSAPELGKAIELVPEQTSRVVVDLSGVTFLDSSGLNALVRGSRSLDGKEIVFHVVVPGDSVVRRVFEITHLTESLSVVDSVDRALALP